MKQKRRDNLTKPISKFKAPSTFSAAIRIDPNEDKKKLGTLEPGPGQYNDTTLNSFVDNSQASIVAELIRNKKKEMRKMDGLDLDNNGIDDGLEIEALLPEEHVNKTTSSFYPGEVRDSLKLMRRYGKGGSNPDIPGCGHYHVDYQGRSPSMNAKQSKNVLTFVKEPIMYNGKTISPHGRTKGAVGATDRKYDALGSSYDKEHLKWKKRMRKTRSLSEASNSSPSSVLNPTTEEVDDEIEENQLLPLLLKKKKEKMRNKKNLTYHERKRRPRSKSRHGLEEETFFTQPTPQLQEDVAAHNLSSSSFKKKKGMKKFSSLGSSTSTASKNMEKALREKKRLKMDMKKLGNVFFASSPKKLRPKDEEWQQRLQ
jgi:hypothetical protein